MTAEASRERPPLVSSWRTGRPWQGTSVTGILLVVCPHLAPQQDQQNEHLQRCGDAVGQGEAAKTQAANQGEAEEDVERHGGDAGDNRRGGIVERVEDPHHDLDDSMGDQAEGKKAQRVGDRLRAGGVETAPLEEKLDQGFVEHKEQERGRYRQEEDQPQQAAERFQQLGAVAGGDLCREGGEGNGSYGLGKDALRQQHQQPGVVEGTEAAVRQSAGQDGVDEKLSWTKSRPSTRGPISRATSRTCASPARKLKR